MSILGRIITNILIVMILGITSGLFILLPTSPTGESILEENTFGRLENQKVRKEKYSR